MSDAFKARVFLAIVFLAMVLGMLGKAYYDRLLIGKGATMPDLGTLAIPLIVSPMIFGVIFSAVKTTEVVPALILAFQNGFFWQDIFSGLGQVPNTGGSEVIISPPQ